MTFRDAARLAEFEQRIAGPRQALAVVWLPLIIGTRVPTAEWLGVLLDLASTGIWLAFFAELVWRVRLAADRRAYVRGHLFDIAALAFPPLRALWGLAPFRDVVLRPGFGAFLASTVLVLLASAGLVYAIEREAAGTNIDSFGDAVWWAFVTATTVGYGDHTPVSGLGRSVAGGLVLVGVVLYSVVTAHITAYVLERSHVERDAAVLCRLEATAERLEELAATLVEVRAEDAAGRVGQHP